MRFFPALGFLALIIQCGCLPFDILSGLSWPDESSLAAALTRVKKDADGFGYVEECAFVNSWQEQPGYINVLAFLDASWEYSHRQATMLKKLQGRFERAGIRGIKYFVINSAEPEAAVNNADIEDEKVAWNATEHSQNYVFSDIEQTREALKEKVDPDIAFFQDNESLKIWEKLSAARDQVIVIDQCGRLSYRVIVPWSILHFPYVKAAILSTYKEQPCGACDLGITSAAEKIETQTESLPELSPENLDIERMKEIAVKTYNLDESDNIVKKIYHDSATKDIPEHVIELLNGTASAKHAVFNNSMKHGPLLSTGDSGSSQNFHLQNSSDENHYDTEQESPLGIEETLNMSENRSQDDANDPLNVIGDGLESQDTNDGDRIDFLVDNHEANDGETTESATFENPSMDYEDKDYAKADSYSAEGGENDENKNWRSSSLEDIDNRIKKISSNSDETDSENDDYVIPIRIIMHAPHIHKHKEAMNKYEYLVLKFGEADYHGHLNNDNEFPSNNSRAENYNEDIKEDENYEAESGSGEISGDEISSGNIARKEEREKMRRNKHLDVVYDKDESPGFYGEDSDYWRNSGNVKYEEKLLIENPEEERKDGESLLEGGYIPANIMESDENNSTPRYQDSKAVANDYGEIVEAMKPPAAENQTDEEEEEEISNHLFAHYIKLIPWLDYDI